MLNTETTGRDADAKIVELGVTTGSGRTLLDTLVNPGVPIPEAASAIHGIEDQDVRHALRFADVLPQLTKALRGRRVIIYNRAFDTDVLAYELDRHHRTHTPLRDGIKQSAHEPHPAATAWMDAQQWDWCAMKAYAVHVGEWNDYHGNWAWQRLNGGHRAVGDCRASLPASVRWPRPPIRDQLKEGTAHAHTPSALCHHRRMPDRRCMGYPSSTRRTTSAG